MRTLKRNKQKMYYATYVAGGEPIYKLDDDDNPIISYVDDDGEIYYEILGETQPHYSEPFEFSGNIAMSGSGEAEVTEFGLNLADYNAVLVVERNSLPIDEKTLIWYESAPSIDDEGFAIEESADYRVVKVSPSLNVSKYVLAKRTK